ncbi:hypothetical protein ACRYI5_10835 [Furfurilactobacillus sp. WILCCON 0119]
MPKQFKAMRITVTNNNVPVNLAADTNSSSSKTQKNAQKQLQFNVLPKQVKTEHGLKYEGRKAYAIGVVGDEIKQQQGYIAQNQQKIKDANQAINTAKDNLKQNQADNQYNTAGQKKRNEQTVATYESQIKSQTATVKTQQGKIKSHQTKIKLLQQEQRDIQSGAYKLQGSVEFSRFK